MIIKRGLFSVFEGIDGAGTTTQSLLLAQYAREELGLNIYHSAEPTDGLFGRIIRQFLRSEEEADPEEIADLFILDRVRHNKGEGNRGIIKTLKDGDHVILDRYVTSSLAYQTTAGVSLEYVLGGHERKSRWLEKPDITYYLKISPEIAINRIFERSHSSRKKNEIYEALDFLTQVTERYNSLVEEGSEYLGRVVVIDGDRDMEEIAEEIREDFTKAYNIWKDAA